MTIKQKIQQLMQMLSPEGRAFRIDEGSTLYRYYKVIAGVFARVRADADQILNDILPDNPNFDIDDAHKWYKRLGLYDSGSVPLADMKLAIAQKMSFPLTPLNKRSPDFIQAQLQAAGFNVYVYRNKFSDGMGGWITKTPDQILGIATGNAELGGFNLGELNLGSSWADDGISIIANYIDETKDAGFDFGDNYRSTFYIADNTIDTFATVDVNRKDEFRQLILRLKAQHAIGFLFINYV